MNSVLNIRLSYHYTIKVVRSIFVTLKLLYTLLKCPLSQNVMPGHIYESMIVGTTYLNDIGGGGTKSG